MIPHFIGEFNRRYLKAALRPVAGTAGDLLPGLLVDPVRVLLDRKILAAPRAAKRDRPSADPELDRFAADLAVHKDLKPNILPQRNAEGETARKAKALFLGFKPGKRF
jgi:hypothetical protein